MARRRLFSLFYISSLWIFLSVITYMTQREYPYNKEPLSYADLFRCDLHQCTDSRHSSSSCLSQARLVLTRLLRQFSLAASKTNLIYFLYKKSLLAAARCKGHVPADFPNIEIAVFQNDIQKLLKVPLQVNNTVLELTPEKKKHPNSIIRAKLIDTKSCLLRTQENGLFMDIAVLKKDTKGSILDSYTSKLPWLRNLKGPHYYSERDIFPLRTLKFDGFSFAVPRSWEKLLTSWYGKNWGKSISLMDYEVSYNPTEAVDPIHSCKERTSHTLIECS
ncbi:uncharacterized protein LOC116296106 [Actinia tenebrosa]|uniref:Uncharacterized protein LOC116296106 n=1 Tax=Actinia tenebrosa TaxID=6105 RepID=A0A6P8HX07_ACTTE|nr:uncharacterized protein LOC116296106 [Actinia tenebrosa]